MKCCPLSVLFLSTDPIVKLSILFLAMGQFVYSFFLTCFYFLHMFTVGLQHRNVFSFRVLLSDAILVFSSLIVIVIWMLKVLNHEMERLLVFG